VFYTALHTVLINIFIKVIHDVKKAVTCPISVHHKNN